MRRTVHYRPLLLLLFILSAIALRAHSEEERLTVHFEKDRHELLPATILAIDSFVKICRLDGDHAFNVHGHTDSDGSLAYNANLADQRAAEVVRYMASIGVAQQSMTVGSSGKTAPVAPNRNELGMARNRRVTITFTRRYYDDLAEFRKALAADTEQHFAIRNDRDTVLVGTAGVVLKIDANSLVTASGKPAQGPVNIDLVEALCNRSMVAHGLSTRSGDRVLETGGMLKVTATDAQGAALQLAAGKNISVEVPAQVIEADMELFLSGTGADWQPTGQLLAANRRRPVRPIQRPIEDYRVAFQWPVYLEDQTGRPRAPLSPINPRVPKEPSRTQYMQNVKKGVFANTAKSQRKAEGHYNAAMGRYANKNKKYERANARYRDDVDSYPAAMRQYEEQMVAWNQRKAEEKTSWERDVLVPAQRAYERLNAVYFAKMDSMRAERAARYQAMIASDSLAPDDLEASSIAQYLLNSNSLGWINVDRFLKIPESERSAVIASRNNNLEEQLYLICTDIASTLSMYPKSDRWESPAIPRSEAAMLFAFTVIDGRPHLYYAPATPGVPQRIEYRPSSFAEINALLATSRT